MKRRAPSQHKQLCSHTTRLANRRSCVSHLTTVHFEICPVINLKAKIGPSCFSSFCFQIFEEEGKENLCDHHRSFHHTCLLVRALGTMRAATFQGILVRAVALVAFAALSVSAFHTVSTSSVSAPWAVLRASPHAARSGAVPPINVSARSRMAAASNTPIKVPCRQLEMMRSLPPSCPPHKFPGGFLQVALLR